MIRIIVEFVTYDEDQLRERVGDPDDDDWSPIAAIVSEVRSNLSDIGVHAAVYAEREGDVD